MAELEALKVKDPQEYRPTLDNLKCSHMVQPIYEELPL